MADRWCTLWRRAYSNIANVDSKDLQKALYFNGRIVNTKGRFVFRISQNHGLRSFGMVYCQISGWKPGWYFRRSWLRLIIHNFQFSLIINSESCHSSMHYFFILFHLGNSLHTEVAPSATYSYVVCLRFNFLDRSLEMAVKCHRFCMHCVPIVSYSTQFLRKFYSRDAWTFSNHGGNLAWISAVSSSREVSGERRLKALGDNAVRWRHYQKTW